MKKLPFLTLLLFFFQVNSQYYYKDIVGAADVTRQLKTYVANNVKKVIGIGVTPEGAPASDFSETQEVLANGTILKITTKNNQVTSALRYVFNSAGLLVTSIDSSEGIRSVSNYTYNADGKIISISNTTTDADSSAAFSQTEVHNYSYKDGKLDVMWRIINKTDSLEVRFISDKNGNIIQEMNVKRGVFSDPIDYYYDDKNRLTDIVRFNHKANRPLPDFMFEYDESDRVIQKINVVSSSKLGYLTWRYLFNEKGLKTTEALFVKERTLEGGVGDYKLKGRINYTYN
jgi:antitoxin component YwqK of YwqJK toxin-antitoxin module